MGEGLTIVIYLLLGLGVVGALYYAVMQITVRQRRLDAEMTRLERLAAEVAMSAEAILERVDERIDYLEKLSAALEARAAQIQPPPAEGERPRPKRTRSRQAGARAAQAAETSGPAGQPAAEPESPEEAGRNYAEIRTRVYAMADAGHDELEIARALGIPRGEVQLILNLRSAKMNA